MQFPRPMNDRHFNNKYDEILWTFSPLLDRFEKEDQLFPAQSIWWIASVIQFTEILTYYRHYKISPGDSVRNNNTSPEESTTADSCMPTEAIPKLDLNRTSESEKDLRIVHPSRLDRFPLLGSEKPSGVDKMRRKKVLTKGQSLISSLDKTCGYSNQDLEKIFGPLNKQLRKDLRQEIPLNNYKYK